MFYFDVVLNLCNGWMHELIYDLKLILPLPWSFMHENNSYARVINNNQDVRDWCMFIVRLHAMVINKCWMIMVLKHVIVGVLKDRWCFILAFIHGCFILQTAWSYLKLNIILIWIPFAQILSCALVQHFWDDWMFDNSAWMHIKVLPLLI